MKRRVVELEPPVAPVEQAAALSPGVDDGLVHVQAAVALFRQRVPAIAHLPRPVGRDREAELADHEWLVGSMALLQPLDVPAILERMGHRVGHIHVAVEERHVPRGLVEKLVGRHVRESHPGLRVCTPSHRAHVATGLLVGIDPGRQDLLHVGFVGDGVEEDVVEVLGRPHHLGQILLGLFGVGGIDQVAFHAEPGAQDDHQAMLPKDLQLRHGILIPASHGVEPRRLDHGDVPLHELAVEGTLPGESPTPAANAVAEAPHEELLAVDDEPAVLDLDRAWRGGGDGGEGSAQGNGELAVTCHAVAFRSLEGGGFGVNGRRQRRAGTQAPSSPAGCGGSGEAASR